MEPEEELQEGEQEQQSTIWKGNIPQKILKKSTIDEIRGYQDDDALIDFTARNFKKKIRDQLHVNKGQEYNINSLEDWTRLVFLAKEHSTRIPSDGTTISEFSSRIKKSKKSH